MNAAAVAGPDLGVVSVLVCTCNRPAEVRRAVDSLLAAAPSEGVGIVEIDLIVVDQSDNRDSEHALCDLIRAGHIRYVESKTRGKGAAMNEGLRLARSPYVVCTDDDCEAPPGWAADMAALLVVRPRVAVAFCRVEAAPHDLTKGYVPQYLPDREHLLSSPMATGSHRGLGAGMVLRRDVVLSLGGIDESFGPGARFPSGDDWDLEVRVLLKGWEAFETEKLFIVHHGFRTFAEGRVHARRDWLALGAAAAKPVRAGHPGMIWVAAYVFAADAVRPIARDVVALRAPGELQRVLAFCRGFAQGLATPVDRSTLRYRRPRNRVARAAKRP
ncbi:MAG: glycosyltransferase family A protein [Acidimicrobiales bacterium]